MKTRRLILAVLILSVFLIEARAIRGQQPEPAPKTYKFPMEHKPWKDVWDWLTETTGKPVITVHSPTGKFPCLDLANKEFTIPEVLEIINEALQIEEPAQEYYLVSRERSFTLIAVESGGLSSRVRPEHLGKNEKTKLVSIVLQLQLVEAADVAPQIKKMMGPFGEAIPMTHPGVNNLILIDTADNLRLIREMLGKCNLLHMRAAEGELRRRTDSRVGEDTRFNLVGSGR